MNQRPIFILGAHKSGTSLVRSILDGHPDLFVIPIESHFFQNRKYWVDNDYRFERPSKVNHREIYNRFIKYIERTNNSDDKYSDSISKNIFNISRFKYKFSKINRIINDDKKLIQKYFNAIYYSLHGNNLPENKRVVEKSVENAEFAIELSNLFPKAKFINIIRNPYSNIVSLRNYKSMNFGYPIIYRIIKTLYNNYYFLYKNRKLIKNYFVIRYEDLVTHPKKIVLKMCDFLDIEFKQILLKPTYNSEPWQGNSTKNKNFNEISKERLDSWQNNIHPMETYYINFVFKFVLDDYNYKFHKTKGSFWRPAKGENIKRYLANRIYKFYLTEGLHEIN